jgi:dolichyl-phosphate-mannose-protein mannosyltransferase
MTSMDNRRRWAWVAVVLIVATAIRLPFVEFNPSVMGDLNTMARWAEILAAGGSSDLLALTGQSVLYPPLSLAAIWIGGAIDQAVLVIKLLGIVGDIGLAALVAWMLRARSSRVVIGATVAVAFNPAFWYLSAFWGQIDSLYVVFMVGSLALLAAGATVSGWAAWAVGLAWKLQALVIAPVIVLATLRIRGWRGVLAGFATVVVILGAASVLMFGAGGWDEYFGRLWHFEPDLNISALNAWHIVRAVALRVGDPLYGFLVGGAGRVIGIAGLVFLVGLTSIAMRRNPGRVGLAMPSATLTLGTFVLLTAMRERYMLAALPLFLLVGVGWESGRVDRAALIAFLVVTVTQTVNLIAVAPFAPDLWSHIFFATQQGPLGPLMKLLGYMSAAANILVLIWASHRMWRSARRVESQTDVAPGPPVLTVDA